MMRALANRRRGRVALVLSLIVVAAGAFMLWLRDDAGGAAIVPHRMLLSGRARGLYPGAWKAMRVTVRNPTRPQIVGGRIRIRMVVRLSTAAPDACQGVRLPVRFHARGMVA